MLSVTGLNFTHKSSTRQILNQVCFALEPGQLTVILGPNGSGKTTLFKCLCGLWPTSSGSIKLDSRELTSLSSAELARIVAVVPQDHEPPFAYSVLDAVLLGRTARVGLFASPGSLDYELAEAALEDVGISHLKDKPYTQISGGERQLTLVARALAQDTPLMFLDEPTSHLDYRNQTRVLTTVRRIMAEKGLTVLMTLHDPNLALHYADRAVLLEQGRVYCHGPAHEVITAENLSRMYDLSLEVVRHDGGSFICLKGAA